MFRGTKPAVFLSSARGPVVEITKLLLRTAKLQLGPLNANLLGILLPGDLAQAL